MWELLKMKKIVSVALLCFAPFYVIFAQSWEINPAPLMTSWADDVDPEHVLPDYPRPHMQRADWLNLNGIWQFQEAEHGDAVPFDQTLKEEILVPFPWQSALSGIRRMIPSFRAWYRRTIDIPKSWSDDTILLHFGAVDWESTVYVNGRCVGTHKGGYDAFTFDITPFLEKGEQEIVIGVYDPGSDAPIARGKQANQKFADPGGYHYSASSGIWQTVWFEPVPKKSFITELKIVPDIDLGTVTVKANISNPFQSDSILVVVKDGGSVISQNSGDAAQSIIVPLKNAKLWSPDSPFLYDLEITLLDGDVALDKIDSYVGMRKIALSPEPGLKKIELNNEFLFQMGPLDQGYWPDGLYTAPTDEALKWDIEQIKAFGFNMIRKHVKIEPARWYYWCDKLGLLVWQDMPHTFQTHDEQSKIQFETELFQMVKQHWNFPSIVNWIVFNEHWGLYDVHRLTEAVMALDPSRLVTGNSGIDAGKPDLDYEVGHIKDNHSYRPPNCAFASSTRAVVCGEYGAIGYKIPGHIWDIDGPWVHHNYDGIDAATAEYEKFINQIHDFIEEDGLSAAVYTQWTDVENEMNGIFTYDRKKIKLHKDRVTAANKSTYQK
jgi:beta-galactosidase/beta-glucuronidase